MPINNGCAGSKIKSNAAEKNRDFDELDKYLFCDL